MTTRSGEAPTRAPARGTRASPNPMNGIRSALRARTHRRPDPAPEAIPIHLAGREPDHRVHGFRLGNVDLVAIEDEEYGDRHQPDALVAIDEGMALREAEAVFGGQAGHVDVG